MSLDRTASGLSRRLHVDSRTVRRWCAKLGILPTEHGAYIIPADRVDEVLDAVRGARGSTRRTLLKDGALSPSTVLVAKEETECPKCGKRIPRTALWRRSHKCW